MGNSLITFIVLLWCSVVSASQSNIYVAQTAAGADNGNDVADAHGLVWLNTQGNWGAGGTQAGAGSTIHLSGTITAAVSAVCFSILGSGTAGNPITVKFETGALLLSPVFGQYNGTWYGAIQLTNCSYVTVDGGVNGYITNSQNGFLYTFHTNSVGVHIDSTVGIIVTNLSVVGTYWSNGTNNSFTDDSGIFARNIVVTGNNTNLVVSHCTLKDAYGGLSLDFSGVSMDTIDIGFNTVGDHAQGLIFGSSANSSVCANLNVHDNTISDWYLWQWPDHTDGIILWTHQGTAAIFAPRLYNNYIFGDLGGGSATALIYCTSDVGSDPRAQTVPTIYNNILVSTNSATALWLSSECSNAFVYANTIVATKYVFGSVGFTPGNTNTWFTNNIVSGWSHAINTQGTTLTTGLQASDNNVWFGIVDQFQAGDGFRNYAQYQALGYDAHSQTGDPKLAANYTLQAGSSAIANGANLSPLFNTDKNGTLRAVPWDIGAVAFNTNPPPSRIAKVTNLHAKNTKVGP